VVLVTPTSASTIEVLFNEELSANSISANGAGFEIVDRADVAKKLNVLSATISADGKVVTLATDNQEKGANYVLAAMSSIQDAVGVPLVQGSTNRVGFNSFELTNRPPNVLYVGAVDSNTVEHEFQDGIKPSTLNKNSITIYENDNTMSTLKVVDVKFVEKATTVYVTTENQKSNLSYRINIENVESYDGVKRDNAINKMFKGFKIAEAQKQKLANSADLNGDGKVDFIDFTMFSAVYGMTFGTGSAGSPVVPAQDVINHVPTTTGQPIVDKPDSTVPHTTPIGQ